MENFFKSITDDELLNETSLWKNLIPLSSEEKFLRWIFAFLSIHTTWEANVTAFNNLKDLSWITDKVVDYNLLLKILTESKVGLQNNRSKAITSFTEMYLDNPEKYDLSNKSITYRHQLINEINGIGITKISFVSEMHSPLRIDSYFCIDTHMLRFFSKSDIKLKTKSGQKEYIELESYWHTQCKQYNIPSFIARSIYWNRIQKQSTSNYWAYCLKDTKIVE